MDLSLFLKTIGASHHEWKNALQYNTYNVFKIPKKNGNFRTIEAPSLELKNIQKKIARYFQSIYHENLPATVHGYILKDPIRMISRDIRTNAMAHLGRDYLLNVDLKDFFYQVDVHALNNFLNQTALTKPVKKGLRKLCLKDKRLPMGAPSSPVLSNIAFRAADEAMAAFAARNDFSYTRYVDDLSFLPLVLLLQIISLK